MKLEWDETKRIRTLRERGLDFADVAQVNWETALTLEDTRQPYPETRYITYALLAERLCVIAWCYRGERIRVFSLRKANRREIRKHEQS